MPNLSPSFDSSQQPAARNQPLETALCALKLALNLNFLKAFDNVADLNVVVVVDV